MSSARAVLVGGLLAMGACIDSSPSVEVVLGSPSVLPVAGEQEPPAFQGGMAWFNGPFELESYQRLPTEHHRGTFGARIDLPQRPPAGAFYEIAPGVHEARGRIIVFERATNIDEALADVDLFGSGEWFGVVNCFDVSYIEEVVPMGSPAALQFCGPVEPGYHLVQSCEFQRTPIFLGQPCPREVVPEGFDHPLEATLFTQ